MQFGDAVLDQVVLGIGQCLPVLAPTRLRTSMPGMNIRSTVRVAAACIPGARRGPGHRGRLQGACEGTL